MKIKIMETCLSNKIAAGEVVQRPVSIIKELVENSLDAKATTIVIEIENSGIRKISISDDGEGMSESDAVLCFHRHATSKIYELDQLQNIQTLGFRGEALSSISSISKIDLYTGTKESNTGTYIENIGGKISKIKRISNINGTKITVTDMFYNVPARLKYLSSLKTEYNHIINYVNSLILSRSDVKFIFISDGKEKINTYGNSKIKDSICLIYNKYVLKHIYDYNAEDNDFKISGIISHPQLQKPNSKHIYITVNNRVIKSYKINSTIVKAYGNLIDKKSFPLVTLNIEVDPQLLDVNIHPTKMEINISKITQLCSLIKSSIDKTLKEKNLIYSDYLFNKAKEFYISKSIEKSSEYSKQIEERYIFNNQIDIEESIDENNIYTSSVLPITEVNIDYRDEIKSLKVLAQFNNSYILAEYKSNFYIIDQHAAQERIKYDEWKTVDLSPVTTQKLIIPINVSFSEEEISIFIDNASKLNKIGIKFVLKNSKNLCITEVPLNINHNDLKNYINNILEILKDTNKELNNSDLLDDKLIKLSCRYSIKANHYLSRKEMIDLVNQLSNTFSPFTCPHGRPIIIRYSLYNIEKWFKRV